LEHQILVITNPPHGDVDVDAVAGILKLSAVDARLKVGFRAPEVLRAADWDRAREVAEALSRIGLSVAMVNGRELERVPWPEPVLSFALSQEGLEARLLNGEVCLPYDTPVMGVSCKPPESFRPRSTQQLEPGMEGLAVAEAFEWMPRLDVYAVRDGKLRRLTFVQDVVDCSALGAAAGSTPEEGLASVLAECQRRFEDLELDARLENVRPRHRFVAGDAGFDVDLRKMYSFGTLLLRSALEAISPELRDLTHYELGSRMAYVLSRHGGEGA